MIVAGSIPATIFLLDTETTETTETAETAEKVLW